MIGRAAWAFLHWAETDRETVLPLLAEVRRACTDQDAKVRGYAEMALGRLGKAASRQGDEVSR